MRYGAYQPEGFRGKSDAALPQCVKDLACTLNSTQRKFAYDCLRLERKGLQEMAGILTDFAVDIHTGVGMWEAYERYNVEFFGVPLPLTTKCKPEGIHEDRIKQLLWALYPELIPGLALSPHHRDLQRLASASASFLNKRISALPKDAGVKAFLSAPLEYGWDVKRRLVWMGTQSYLFRLFFRNYIAEQNDGVPDISSIDAFVCQDTTRLSGLGAIDILAGTLDIKESDRRELRSWYEPHLAPYKVLSENTEVMKALNLASKERYVIRINMKRFPFKVGEVVFGSLTPWRGEWYWSGEQHIVGAMTRDMVDELVNTMRRKSSQILCRYWKDYERQVRKAAARHCKSAKAFHKTDLLAYPDGLAMAADWEKEMKSAWDAAPPHKVQDAIKRHGLKRERPDLSLPDEVVNCSNGVAVFINPDEGKEVFTGYKVLLSALKRRGESLSDEQAEAIQGFIFADAISPAFVQRVTAEHGAESIKEAFMLRECDEGFWLDYLLRAFKGHFYRKRYPSMSVI